MTTARLTSAAPTSSPGAFVVSPPEVAAIPVIGASARFPIRRIFCIGRNYADHAREMGHNPEREPPFFFLKPADAYLPEGEPCPYPPATTDLHHEVELVVALASGGTDIAAGEALRHVFGYAVGIDMTRRDLQGEAKRLQRPWEVGKAFDASAPIGTIVPAAQAGDVSSASIALTVNGRERQSGRIADMIWSVPEIIAHVSRSFALKPGDLIMTGTPAGVGPVVRGDVMEATIQGLPSLKVAVR